MKSKKGLKFGDFLPLALFFVVTIIAVGIGAQVLSGVESRQCKTGYIYNTTTDTCYNSTGSFESGAGMTYAANITTGGHSGLATFGQWMPTVALVLSAGVVITLLVSSFMKDQ